MIQVFQFLLVRLRVDKANVATPYLYVFQFLLVRLRAGLKYLKLDDTAIFQFLLVRLREIRGKVITALSTSFNSFWCD